MKALHFIRFFGIAVLLVAITSCKTEPQDGLTKEDREWIENTLSSMSIEQKVGQLLAPAISPPKNESDLAKIEIVTEWINSYHIGHVYITSNRLDPERTAIFINDIQGKSELPILIHTDLETGLGGILESGSFEESALRSILAGNDIVLLWTDPRFELIFPHILKAAKALFGEEDITGTLAVTIPELYTFGHGISYTASTNN